jgi:PBP4 family serine-type D-alanyl-D-alanine carboxypeptidase
MKKPASLLALALLAGLTALPRAADTTRNRAARDSSSHKPAAGRVPGLKDTAQARKPAAAAVAGSPAAAKPAPPKAESTPASAPATAAAAAAATAAGKAPAPASAPASPAPVTAPPADTGKKSARADSAQAVAAAAAATTLTDTIPVPVAAPGRYVTQASPYLAKQLEDFWKRSRLGGKLAVSVYSTRYGRMEVAFNDTDWFTPASCLKLIVTASAIDTFPINWFPATTLEAAGAIQGRTLKGSVRVTGGGDPNISDRFFPDALSPLEPFVDSLRALGIDTLRGRIEVNDSFFSSPHRPDVWKEHHFNTWYGAEISALSYNDNCFTLTVLPGAKPGSPALAAVKPDVGYVRIVNHAKTVAGAKRRIVPAQNPDSTVITLNGYIGNRAPGFQMILPVRNPTAYFKASFLRAMALKGLVFVPDTSSPVTPVLRTFRYTTAPLTDVVEEINQRSQNLHAEMTLRHLGKLVKGEGTPAAGIRAEKEFLHRIGLDTAQFELFDGSGLSPYNRIKPRGMAMLLAKMARHRYVDDYIGSLASPGLDGATGRRLRPMMQSNLIRYKTGSINEVQGLCGYAFGIDGDTLATALFINGFRGSSEKAQRLMDSLLVRVALWYNKERPALADAHRLLARADAPADYIDRLKYFSGALQGRPYFLGPTGEGRFGLLDTLPLMDLSRFDCVTFIENTMALASAHQTREVLPHLLSVRYRSDTLGFPTRNHYFVQDWLRYNAGKVRLVRFPGDTLIHKPIDKVKFFKAKNLEAPRDPGVPAANPVCDIAYMPYAKALEMMGNWTFGEKFLGVAFVTDIAGLDVTHTGFLLADGKTPPLFRNASQLMGKVSTVSFKDYLIARKGKTAGVLFFEFIPPPGG